MSVRRKFASRSLVMRLAPALCLLMLAGCEGFRGFEGDPLTGGPPIPRAPANNPNIQTTQNTQNNPIPPLAAGGPAPQGTLPPLSAPSTSTSPAALTGGGANPTLDASRDLRIGTGLGGTPPPFGPAPSTGAGVILRQPQPINDGSQTAVPALVNPNVTLVANRVDSYQQLKDGLGARGVTWLRLETIGDNGDYKFTCSIPSRTNPNMRTNYVATAKTELDAMRAVIDQIDREQQKRPGGA